MIFLLSPEAFIKHFPLGLSPFIFVFCTSGSPARFHYSCLNLSSPSALSNKRPYCTSGYNQESGSFTVFFFALWLQRLTEAHSQVKVFLSSKGKMTCEFLTMALNMHLLHLWNSYRLQVVDGLLPWLLTVPSPPPPLYFSSDVKMMGIPPSTYRQVCLINSYRLSTGGTCCHNLFSYAGFIFIMIVS